jgi:sn-glycerol 3-phosphate transport system ATP-binding protein
MSSVTLSNVKKVYAGGVEAVKGVSLNVPDGAFVVLVGPSGCGKSTLLRMVAGLETISSGQISIGDRVVNEIEPADRDIAMVFQNYALYPHMSVFDNMAYGLRNRGTPADDVTRRVSEAATLLGIGGLLDRKPKQLSGGQRQRVAMGRAIVRKPAAFLFDEPLSNLDAQLRVQMRLEIKKLQRDLGTTSLYVTHDQVEAMTMADILVVMNAGRAEQIGAPREIYQRPASQYVAGFIGSPAMNFLPARINDARDGVLVSGLNLPMADVAARITQLSNDGTVTLGIRPEHLIVSSGTPDLSLAIDLIEHLGTDTLFHGHISGAGRPTPLTVRQSGDVGGKTGDRLPLTFDRATVHEFDTVTGARI